MPMYQVVCSFFTTQSLREMNRYCHLLFYLLMKSAMSSLMLDFTEQTYTLDSEIRNCNWSNRGRRMSTPEPLSTSKQFCRQSDMSRKYVTEDAYWCKSRTTLLLFSVS